MINLEKGVVIAKGIGGKLDDKLIYIDKDVDENDETIKRSYCIIMTLSAGVLEPRLPLCQRSVTYIAGPSGSGKSTHAMKLIRPYVNYYPDKPFFLFSRTDYKKDPVFEGMKVLQIPIDNNLLEKPIDIETELPNGAIILFDDCGTIRDIKLKKYIEHLICDICEVGRKLDINIIITNHLIIPDEKKYARCLMNEIQTMTVFPKSGSSQQIRYALATYFELGKNQIDTILALGSRWVTISKSYPMHVIYDKGAFIL